ncbi:cyclin-Q-like isoform X2 [Homarus americanus]|uniref:Cyclin-Q n=1 Tax=Homarus americanus TaxID=6706 RepID=A0A8J5TCR4_HOMAM|nr:cyclin-Q-like isoform X2 [Homarus americanus]KAG7171633.1 Cyclin-Q-like [Homarus americanus]
MNSSAKSHEDGKDKRASLLQINLMPKEFQNPPVDYTKNYNHFSGARFIIECGIKLKASVLTTATAATYYHKFFTVATLEEYDPYLIGSTCIYLASKVEDDDIKIRDIINVGISNVRRGDAPLSLDPYFSLRDSLIQAELLLMRVLGFKMRVELPHKFILHYLLSLKEWLGEETFKNIPIVHMAWTITQDIYHSPIVLKHSPQLLAVTVLNIVIQVYGIVVPGDDELSDRSWFTVLQPDCTTQAVWNLTSKILLMYQEEEDLVLSIIT